MQHKLDENNSNQQVHTAVQQYNIQYTILCSLNKDTHSMYGGDCDAAIAKAAAAVTHVQSQSQEVGSGDGRAGLVVFFYLSSAETDFWWLEDEQ